ncbi:MAG TPA: protein translocase subunit SecD [Gemmatimonadota bacterium]|nr:protein translocase subunit SecD [Gemmatimonadota bacterium]
MRHDLRIRWAIVAISLVAAAWYLWPTVRLYSMSPQARQALEREDPAAWDGLKSRAIQLGLDLQGGMHLVLELDESGQSLAEEERRDAIDRALEIIRNRVDQFGVSEPLIQKVGDERIIVELPGIQDQERAKELVQRTAFLEFQMVVDGRELTDRLRAVDAALAGRSISGADSPPDGAEVAPSDTTGADSLDASAGPATGTLSAAGQDTAGSTSLGEFLGQTEEGPATALLDSERPLSSLLQTEQVGAEAFDLLVDETEVERVRAMLADPAAVQAVGAAHEWHWSGDPTTFADGRSYRRLYLVEGEAEMTGETIATAAAGFDPQQMNQPIVTLRLTDEGARRFADVTGRHVGQRMAIVLDEVVRMAPNIRQRITGGNAQIEGFDSVEEARDIAIVLRAGALPAPLEIIEERTVGPSLGADSIASGWRSGWIGLLAVGLLIILYYRLSGVVANVGLALNFILILAALGAFGATLTLPGIAGLLLTVGMSVDANVLVFERVREELALGKSVRAAIDVGYDRALVTILDSQITTLIAAAVLFQFGTGPVKGFAVVLTIGIISSIFTAVFVTRTIFETWSRYRSPSTLSI